MKKTVFSSGMEEANRHSAISRQEMAHGESNLRRLILLLFLVGSFWVWGEVSAPIAKAGDLDSAGSPGATSYTLTDIFNRLTTNTASTEADHNFFPGAEPASSFHTLKEIYEAIPVILPETVKSGTDYLGISGTLLPEGGTAEAANVLSGKTFFGNNQSGWNLQTGTMADVGQLIITPGTSNQTITQGYHDGTGYVQGDADLTAGKIKSGVTLFGVDGEYPSSAYPLSGDTGSTDATAAEICNNNEAWTKAGVLLTGTMNPTAGSIGVGKTYCGISGTLLKNEYSGTAGSSVADYAYYTQAKGGVDDYNNGGSIPSDAYKGTWTACNSGNNYCDTGDSTYADKKDDSTGLVWSKWLDSGTTHTWFWANNCYEPGSAENPDACAANGDNGCQCIKKTSSEVGCESIGDGNWRTPYQKELMLAYIDGSWGNLSSAGNYYWSATTHSYATQNAWYVSLSSGDTSTTTKSNAASYRVRCVR